MRILAPTGTLSAGPQLQTVSPMGEKGARDGCWQAQGPGASHLLLTPDHVGNVVGIDPHKRTLSAAVVDARGGLLASAFPRLG